MLTDNRIRKTLIAAGMADAAEVSALVATASRAGRSLYREVILTGRVAEEQLVAHLAAELGIPSVSLSGFANKPELAALVPVDLVRTHRALPVGLKMVDGVETLYVAVEDPLDVEALEALGQIVPHPVIPLLAGPVDLDAAIARCTSTAPPPAPHDDLFAEVLENLDEHAQSDMLSALSLLDDIPRNRHEVVTSPSGFQEAEGAAAPGAAVDDPADGLVEDTDRPRLALGGRSNDVPTTKVTPPGGLDAQKALAAMGNDEGETTGLGKPAASSSPPSFQRVTPDSVAVDRWATVPPDVFTRALAHALVDAGVVTPSAVDAAIRKLSGRRS